MNAVLPQQLGRFSSLVPTRCEVVDYPNRWRFRVAGAWRTVQLDDPSAAFETTCVLRSALEEHCWRSGITLHLEMQPETRWDDLSFVTVQLVHGARRVSVSKPEIVSALLSAVNVLVARNAMSASDLEGGKFRQ